MSPQTSHWFYVAGTTPNMAVHRACAKNAGLEAMGIKIGHELLRGDYVCYLCGNAIKTTDSHDQRRKVS